MQNKETIFKIQNFYFFFQTMFGLKIKIQTAIKWHTKIMLSVTNAVISSGSLSKSRFLMASFNRKRSLNDVLWFGFYDQK